MIARLEGIVWDTNESYMTVGVGGIGFKVYTTTETKEVSHKGGAVSLWTHLVVREDALDLYGFLSQEERGFFELLISISGIGPKTALSILNVNSVTFLRRAIANGSATELVKISGIGKKIAEKIILELKDKVGPVEDMGLREEIDAIEALKSLGYTQKEARDALAEVNPAFTATSDRIKEALKSLGRA